MQIDELDTTNQQELALIVCEGLISNRSTLTAGINALRALGFILTVVESNEDDVLYEIKHTNIAVFGQKFFGAERFYYEY